MGKTGKRSEKKLRSQIIEELAAIGLARATHCLELGDGTVELKSAQQIRGQSDAAIASIEKTSAGYKVKFYDKLKALELLGSHLGVFGAGKQQDAPQNNLLEAILEATKEPVNTNDLPELQ